MRNARVAVLVCVLLILGSLLLGAATARADEYTTTKTDVQSFPTLSTEQVRCAFVPNDPYFHKDTPGAGWLGQWHLVNEHTSGLDVRVQGAWNRDITGSGVTIGIVDDCLETSHPDLAPNYVAADSWDFGQNDNNPNPVRADDQHGISVSGVAAARGGNSTGVTGAAPYAGLAGLRVDFYNQTTQMFIDATLYHSSGANTNITIKNHSYSIQATYIFTTSQETAVATSVAAGTVHTWAAGNDRGTSGQDVNKKDCQNSPDVIAVVALGSDGDYASYCNFGACVFVAAPSNSSGLFRITTTDRTGTAGYNTGSGDTFPDNDYTSIFGGTSSSSPLVAGVMALVKQVQPNIDTRFAKHLLVRTCDVVDAGDSTIESDGGWRTNAAGNTFNQNYGFGLIDADGLTQLATQYTGVTALETESTGTIIVNASIPEFNLTGISRTFNLASDTPLEEVLVTLDISHTWRGDIEAFLISPSGYESRLMVRSGTDFFADIDWTFTTNAFWGEDPEGTWTLMVRDVFDYDTGTWNSFSVTARMGELVPEPATLCLLAMGGLVLLKRRRSA